MNQVILRLLPMLMAANLTLCPRQSCDIAPCVLEQSQVLHCASHTLCCQCYEDENEDGTYTHCLENCPDPQREYNNHNDTCDSQEPQDHHSNSHGHHGGRNHHN